MVFFTDGSDLEGIKRVKDIKHFKYLNVFLKVLCANPKKEGDKNKRIFYKKCFNISVSGVFLISGFVYVKKALGKLDLFELGHTYITVLMNIVAFSRLATIFLDKYEKLIRDFVNKIHLINCKSVSKYESETILLVHKISHFFTMYVNCFMVLGILLFNGTPLYNNITSGAFNHAPGTKFEHAVYFYLPFDYTHNFKGYLALFCFDWYISFTCSMAFFSMDLIVGLMVFHVWGHTRILIYNLEHFPKPKERFKPSVSEGTRNNIVCNWYSDEDMVKTRKLLKEIILHHRLIMDFSARMSEVFGPMLFIYFAFHQVSGCLLLLECSQMDPKALTRFGPLTIILFQQLVQISVIFELLGSIVYTPMLIPLSPSRNLMMGSWRNRGNSSNITGTPITIPSDQLSDAVYSIPWESMNKSNRQTVYVLLQQAQKPAKVKAIGMVGIGVQTMAAILKTSITYFIMLRNFATEE